MLLLRKSPCIKG